MLNFYDNIGLISDGIKKSNINIPWLDHDDIYQLASMALFNAIKNYKDDIGIKFSTYAYSAIRNTLINELNRGNREINTMSLNATDPYGKTEYIDYIKDSFVDVEKDESTRDIIIRIKNDFDYPLAHDIIDSLVENSINISRISVKHGVSRIKVYSDLKEIKRRMTRWLL